jgi:predicted O-methyltransferase YrrM
MEHVSLHPGDLTMLRLWRAHRTGLAPHYPFLYSLVLGLGAQRVFEFGAGGSTEVLLAALNQTGGRLYSCSPDPAPEIQGPDPAQWVYYGTTSDQALRHLPEAETFDLVLHDGSHSARVVEADLLAILPKVKIGGLVLIHDTLHSYVGREMRTAVTSVMDAYRLDELDDFLGAVGLHVVTLPFGFGLTILQMRATLAQTQEHVSLGPEKATSPHRTLPYATFDDEAVGEVGVETPAGHPPPHRGGR